MTFFDIDAAINESLEEVGIQPYYAPPIWQPQPGPQTMARDSKATIIGFGGQAGGGKALTLDTPIPTPQGWTTMGEIETGDWVFDDMGNICQVVATSGVMINHDVYAVHFDDGSVIKADAGHQWHTFNKMERESLAVPTGAVRTTAEIVSTLHEGEQVNHAIRITDKLGTQSWRYITSVESIPTEPVKCIAVNSPSHLYLAGWTMIPTHNSDLLLGLASTEHKRAIVFRRIYKSLRPLVDRLADIIGSRDGLNESLYRWRLPGNQQIEFGAMQYEHDKEDYRGNPHDYYAFDEVTEFTESQVRFVIGWLRSTIPGQLLRVVLTFNPPDNEEGQWVIDFFGPWLKEDHPNPAQSGEVRYFAMVDGKEVEVESGEAFNHNGEQIVPMSRTFIRARLDDNQYLAHDGAYKSVLQSLPEPMRSQLLKGIFGLKMADDIWQVIPTSWIQAAQARWLITERPDLAMRAAGVDPARGGKDFTAIARLYGVWFDEMIKYPGIQTDDGDKTAELVMRDVPPTTHTCVDVIGIGSSAYDSLKRQKMRVTPVNNAAAAKPSSKDKTGKYFFVNVRAESYWHLREALDPTSGQNICLPPGREVLADLAAPRFKVVAGKLQIEAKEDIKLRIGRSPDVGDAIVLCWKAASGPQFKSGWQ